MSVSKVDHLTRSDGKLFDLYPASHIYQRAKKVVSDSLRLVDFAIGLVIFVLNLPNGQVLFFGGNSNFRRIVINPAHQFFSG